MPDTPRPGHNHPLDSLCLVIACPRGAYDAGKRAHLDTLTVALEAEWYNGNLDEKAYRRLCKIVGNEPYPSAILKGETP